MMKNGLLDGIVVPRVYLKNQLHFARVPMLVVEINVGPVHLLRRFLFRRLGDA